MNENMVDNKTKSDRIPLIDADYGELEKNNLIECISTGWISSQGKFVKEFEDGFGSFCRREYAVATSNGTVALHLALLALDIGEGDEVIVPTLTFAATANAVMHAGATPVFVDSEITSWNMDPILIEAAITNKTRAIIPVHLYGQPSDMDSIITIANKYDLRIVEDAAEAHGATIGDKRAGEFGDISCFSFYANKIITTGEGGMCLTDDADLNEKMRILRDHGKIPGNYYVHSEVGYNYRMTNLQAAIGVAQLTKIEKYIEKKKTIAGWYKKEFADVEEIKLPSSIENRENVFWLYSVLIDEDKTAVTRDKVMDHLQEHNIESRPLFHPLHLMKPFSSDSSVLFPIAEKISKSGITLPTGYLLEEDDVSRIAKLIIERLGAN